MAINWNQPGQRFSFGNLDAAQQTLYEDNPEIAYQKLMDWYGQGNPNFATTTLGRFIASQRDRLNNSYLTSASQQAADWAAQKQTWDAQQAQALAKYQSDVAAAGAALEPYNKLAQAKAFGSIANDPKYIQARDAWSQLQANPYKVQEWQAPGAQLTWTKYLESNPAGMGGLANQFNELTASQRGATPGAFTVKRNLW